MMSPRRTCAPTDTRSACTTPETCEPTRTIAFDRSRTMPVVVIVADCSMTLGEIHSGADATAAVPRREVLHRPVASVAPPATTADTTKIALHNGQTRIRIHRRG